MGAFVDDVLPFLWSTDPAAQTVIVGLLILFFIWVSGLGLQVFRLLKEGATLRKFQPIEKLEEYTREHREGPATLKARDDAFAQFARRVQLDPSRNIARHVKSIFDAGWSDTRLEIGELNRHTTEQLFRRNTLLKAVLGIFIVVGLLGTLLGLSKSLVPLSQIDLGLAATADVSVELQELLEKLKSAFAPSIWGVFLTVVGVLLFGGYLNSFCIPLKTRLEQLTLDEWVPRLYPTTPQRMLKTLEEADRQAHENLQAAQKVAEFAENLDDEIRDFSPRVLEANTLLEGFNTSIEKADEASRQLTSFMGEFGETLEGFSGFQGSLEQLLQEVAEHTAQVHRVFDTVATQQAELTTQLTVIGRYAEGTADEREETLQAIRRTSIAAETALHDLTERNEEVYRMLGEPITEGLDDIAIRLSSGLQTVEERLAQRFDHLQQPLQDSVEQVQSIAMTYEKATERILSEVRDALFDELSGPVATRLEEVSHHLQDGLKSVEDQLSTSFTHLQKPLQSSVDDVREIAQSYEDVTERILSEVRDKMLAELSGPVSEKLTLIDETLHDDLGKLSTDFRRLEAPVSQSVDNIEGIAESFDKNMTRLLGELQREFGTKNDRESQQAKHMADFTQSLEKLAAHQEQMISSMDKLAGEIASSQDRYTVAHFLRDKFIRNGRR